jgi:hypothetical protein
MYIRVLFTLGIAALITGCSSLSGDTTGNSQEKDESGGDAAVAQVRLASALAQHGMQTKNPHTLATAAQILIDAPTRELSGTTTATAGKDRKKTAAEIDAARILSNAQALAGGDKTASARIQALKKRLAEGSRGRVGGAGGGSFRVQARDTDRFNIEFRGSRTAEVGVVGDGDTDLDLYIYDENGNLIESDTDSTDNCFVSWRPRWTGSFRIEIKNLGRVYNDYVLITN